jgi:hypothetical protein
LAQILFRTIINGLRLIIGVIFINLPIATPLLGIIKVRVDFLSPVNSSKVLVMEFMESLM